MRYHKVREPPGAEKENATRSNDEAEDELMNSFRLAVGLKLNGK